MCFEEKVKQHKKRIFVTRENTLPPYLTLLKEGGKEAVGAVPLGEGEEIPLRGEEVLSHP